MLRFPPLSQLKAVEQSPLWQRLADKEYLLSLVRSSFASYPSTSFQFDHHHDVLRLSNLLHTASSSLRTLYTVMFEPLTAYQFCEFLYMRRHLFALLRMVHPIFYTIVGHTRCQQRILLPVTDGPHLQQSILDDTLLFFVKENVTMPPNPDHRIRQR